MKVAFDLDGVIADWTMAFTSLAQQHGFCADHWGAQHQFSWEITELTKQQIDFLWGQIRSSQNWWMSIPPLVNSREVKLINWVNDRHKEIIFLTNRVPSAGLPVEEQAYHWLRGIGLDFAPKVEVVKGTKGLRARELGIDIMLEDKVDNLKSLDSYGTKAVARAWQYNTEWTKHRSKSVEDFIIDHVP